MLEYFFSIGCDSFLSLDYAVGSSLMVLSSSSPLFSCRLFGWSTGANPNGFDPFSGCLDGGLGWVGFDPRRIFLQYAGSVAPSKSGGRSRSARVENPKPYPFTSPKPYPFTSPPLDRSIRPPPPSAEPRISARVAQRRPRPAPAPPGPPRRPCLVRQGLG